MTALTLIAFQTEPVLRCFVDRASIGFDSPRTLADHMDRDPSNLRKTVQSMIAAGLLSADPYADPEPLTADGKAQLAALDRAHGVDAASTGAGSLPVGHIILTHADLIPDPDNARKDWDSPEAVADLTDLAESIGEQGLLQNLMVKRTDEPGVFMLDGGERRWRAIAMLIADGRWPAERPILCRLIETDDLGHRLAALAENLQRRNLNPREKAIAFDGLADALIATGVAPDKVNREIADRLGVTIEHVQQHRAFMKLDEADQERLTLPKDDPRRLTVRDARAKLAKQAEKEAAWSPLQLPADDQLILAELAHAIRAKFGYLGNSIPVCATARADAAAQHLIELHLVGISETPQRWGDDAGHYRISFYGWAISDAVRTAWPRLCGEDEGARAEALAEMQRERARVPADGARYVTPWLNGPFALTPEGQAILDEEAEKERQRNEAAAQRAAEREAAHARWADARRIHQAVLEQAAATPPADMTEATTAAAAGVDSPLPWTLVEDGSIIDANGEQVTRFGNHYGPADDCDLTLGQIIVVAVNTAAGLPTPPIKSNQDEADEDEAAEESDAADSEEAEAE